MAQRVSAIPGIGSPQLTVGLIKGGINTNVVPDRVTFRLDRRMIPEERAAEVEAELRAVIAEAAKAFPEARVERPADPGRRAAGALAGRRADDRAAVPPRQRRSWASRSGPRACRSTPMRRTTPSRGIPVVLYGAGPHTIEEANAHRADERLPLADLRKATEVVALTLLDLLSPAHG